MSDPLFWVLVFPALAVSGLLIQMILSLFSCCATFKLRGRTIPLKWWMIPAAGALCGLLWFLAVLYVLLPAS
ncbi:competence protein ComEC [Pseudodesulfovibrio sp. S3]|uniref:competence protein ComEC n=2 Tax=unclassified Pseudodesulfovibrio TaxID=2661612 RepID=UPI001F4F2224|nr:competence protein ComEC [Pseudodesulfovibrio sp. S3]MCJ2165187.1 competence protein ComEC [Pseudodesulfovibrio sp. S3-i]